MPKNRINNLFSSYEPAIRQIVAEIGELEQRHISMERPRVKTQIDEIITRVAMQELEREDAENSRSKSG